MPAPSVSNDEPHETLIAAIALRRKLPPANQVSAVDEKIGSGRGEAALERDCLFLASFGATAASFTPSDFDPERDRLLCADGVSDFSSASRSVMPRLKAAAAWDHIDGSFFCQPAPVRTHFASVVRQRLGRGAVGREAKPAGQR